MKRILKAISILLALALVITGLAAPASAVSFNTLDSSTALAGASKALSDFYTANTDAGQRLTSFFKDAEEHHAERETEPRPGEDFGELVMYGYSKLGYVSAEELLNIREKPTVNSECVNVLYRGEEINVYGEQKSRVVKEDNTVTNYLWYYVRNDSIGLEGFARSEFILFGDEGRKVAEEVEAEKNGKMPSEFKIADAVDALDEVSLAALQAAVNDVLSIAGNTPAPAYAYHGAAPRASAGAAPVAVGGEGAMNATIVMDKQIVGQMVAPIVNAQIGAMIKQRR